MSGVLWAYGPTTAHVMGWARNGAWQSECSYRVERPYALLHRTDDETDESAIPLTPWCTRCVHRAQWEACNLYAAGLLDGLAWATPAA